MPHQEYGNHEEASSGFPSVILISCLIISLTLIGLGGWKAYEIYSQTLKTQRDQLELQKLTGNILHLDEVLTMSARMGTFTGDTFWENRYMHYKFQLSNAIAETQNLFTKVAGQKHLSQIKQANDKLVEMEMKSFLWVRQEHMENAKELLFSQDYKKNKKAYSQAMKNIISQVDAQIQTQVKSNKELIIKLSIIFMGFILFVCLLTALMLRKYSLQRKTALEMLQKKENSLSEAQAIAQAGNWELNINTGEMSWSDELYRILGKETGSPVDLFTSMSLLHPLDTQRIQKFINKGFFPKSNFEQEVQFLRPDGDWGMGYIIGKIKSQSENQITHLHGVFQDITARKNIEEQTGKYFKAMEESLSSIVITDSAGAIEYANSCFCKTTGYSFEELKGKTHRIFKSAVHSDEFYKNLWDTILSGEKWQGEICNRKKNGDLYWEFLCISPIKNNRGNITHFIGVRLDATEVKESEKKLLHHMNELERSNKDLEDFAHIVAHDLQEPLRKIVVFGDRLETMIVNPNAGHTDNINRIKRSAMRMKSLMDDLLIYSRLNSQAQVLQKINLNHLIKVVIDDLEVRIKETKGQIHFTALPKLEGEPFQIKQVFQNLLSNALKYHRENIPPQINIDFRHEGGLVEILFQDNGIGINEEYKDKIFEPFQRLHGQNSYEGTGMGLAICKKIIEKHHGTLEVHSRLQEGSTFIVTLPQKQPANAANEKALI
jgi:two-component system, LuxR family, sensor kinase FixL